MIRFEHVSFSYGREPVLTDVSFEVKAGETVVVLGVSGSGKSTILKLVSGLVRPQEGRVFINNEDMTPSAHRVRLSGRGTVRLDDRR